MYTNEYEVLITSPCDREYLVAEVYHKLLFAEINQEYGYLEIQIYPTSDQKVILSLRKFVEAIKAAKEYLQAKHVHMNSISNIIVLQKEGDKVCLVCGNIIFATISNELLEMKIPQKGFLTLPLDNFLEVLDNYIMS